MHQVTLVPGDGTGPELCEAARTCLDATGVRIRWEVHPAGWAAQERLGSALPESTLESIRRTRAALKGPVSAPPGAGARGVNAQLRQSLNLFACVRPCLRFAGVRSFFHEVPLDLVVIRETTEDYYFGVEFEARRPATDALIETISKLARRPIPAGSAIGVRPTSEVAAQRIARFAFAYAQRLGRKKVTVVHKANILRYADGMFVGAAREVARDFPSIELEEMIIDSVCLQLMQRPQAFDVLLAPNLYGDILSDLAAGMIGGLGVAPGGNIGEHAAVFEPNHGCAPKYKGQDRVNPTATILSGVMLLRHLGELEAASRLEGAVARVIREGKSVTYDLKPNRDDPSAVGTRAMTDAILEALAHAA